MRQILYVTCNKCGGRRVPHLERHQNLAEGTMTLRVKCHGEIARLTLFESQIYDVKENVIPGDKFTIHGL